MDNLSTNNSISGDFIKYELKALARERWEKTNVSGIVSKDGDQDDCGLSTEISTKSANQVFEGKVSNELDKAKDSYAEDMKVANLQELNTNKLEEITEKDHRDKAKEKESINKDKSAERATNHANVKVVHQVEVHEEMKNIIEDNSITPCGGVVSEEKKTNCFGSKQNDQNNPTSSTKKLTDTSDQTVEDEVIGKLDEIIEVIRTTNVLELDSNECDGNSELPSVKDDEVSNNTDYMDTSNVQTKDSDEKKINALQTIADKEIKKLTSNSNPKNNEEKKVRKCPRPTTLFEVISCKDINRDGSPSQNDIILSTGTVSRNAQLFEKLKTELDSSNDGHHHKQHNHRQAHPLHVTKNIVTGIVKDTTFLQKGNVDTSEQYVKAFGFWKQK